MDPIEYVKRNKGPTLETILHTLKNSPEPLTEREIDQHAVKSGYNMGNGLLNFYIRGLLQEGMLKKTKMYEESPTCYVLSDLGLKAVEYITKYPSLPDRQAS